MRFYVFLLLLVSITGCPRPGSDPRGAQEFFNAATQTDVNISSVAASPSSTLTPEVETRITVSYDYQYRLYPIWEKLFIYDTPASETPLFEYDEICLDCLQSGTGSYYMDCKLDQFLINGTMRLGFGCFNTTTLDWDPIAINSLPTTLYAVGQVSTLNTVAQDIISERTLILTLDNP